MSRRFASRGVDVVVATNAFGMGIDRADVRAVAHLAPPGLRRGLLPGGRPRRARRRAALGMMLVSAADLAQRARAPRARRGGDAELFRHKWSLYLELMRWAEGGAAATMRSSATSATRRRRSGCGRCDVCLSLADEGAIDAEAVTLVVRKALSAVARIHGRFGLGAAAKLLHGEADPRLQAAGPDRTPTFGALSAHPETWLLRLLRRCVTAGFVDFAGSSARSRC